MRNPNLLFDWPRRGRSLAQTAKASLSLLEANGVILDFAWKVAPDGRILGFEVWPASLDHPPMYLTVDEAGAFARGARAQHLLDEGRVLA